MRAKKKKRREHNLPDKPTDFQVCPVLFCPYDIYQLVFYHFMIRTVKVN